MWFVILDGDAMELYQFGGIVSKQASIDNKLKMNF